MEQEALQVTELLRFIAWERAPLAVLLAVGGWLSLTLFTRFLDDMGERLTDRRLLTKKIKAASQFVAYALLGLLVGSTLFEIHEDVLFALAGTVGIAVGFAFKDLLASLVTGVILLLDEPFQVGDRIAFGDYYGEVAEIGLRSVRLITLDDNLVTIPNSQFLSQSVASANAGALDCMVVIPFYIGAAEDFETARRIIAEVTATSRYVFLDKPLTTLVADEFMGERFVTVIRVKAYVFDARFEKPFASDVTVRVKHALQNADIRTPDRMYRDLDIAGQETPPEAA